MRKLIFNRQRKRSGFADTKEYPHRNHPAVYKNVGDDIVEYITFTHHDVVEINGKKYMTIPLNDNIDKRIQKLNKGRNKKEISHAYSKVFVGKRSALGKENNNYSLTSEDKQIVDNLYKTLPREYVKYISNSRKAYKK